MFSLTNSTCPQVTLKTDSAAAVDPTDDDLEMNLRQMVQNFFKDQMGEDFLDDPTESDEYKKNALRLKKENVKMGVSANT